MIQELLNYQEADAKLHKIEQTLSGSEERKKAVAAKKYLDGVEENLNKLNLKASELYALYEKCLEDANKLKEQETEFSGAAKDAEDRNAVDYLAKKTEEILGQVKTLSSTANKISEEIQGVLKEYSAIRSKTKAAQDQYKENYEKYAELKNSVKDEKDEVEKELAELQKKVDPALMERYLKKRAGKIYPVVYEVKNSVCGACNMQLSMNELNRLKNGEIIECDHCGRLLFSK